MLFSDYPSSIIPEYTTIAPEYSNTIGYSPIVPAYSPIVSSSLPFLNYYNRLTTGNLGLVVNFPQFNSIKFPSLTKNIKNAMNYINKSFIKIGNNHYQCNMNDANMKKKLHDLILPQILRNKGKSKDDQENITVDIKYWCGGKNIVKNMTELVDKIKNEIKSKLPEKNNQTLLEYLKKIKQKIYKANEKEEDLLEPSESEESIVSELKDESSKSTSEDSIYVGGSQDNNYKATIKLFTNNIMKDNYANYKIIPYNGEIPKSYYEKLINSSFDLFPTKIEKFY